MAGTLWGGRDRSGPTGFLLRPADGFESPPHIHNVAYRGGGDPRPPPQRRPGRRVDVDAGGVVLDAAGGRGAHHSRERRATPWPTSRSTRGRSASSRSRRRSTTARETGQRRRVEPRLAGTHRPPAGSSPAKASASAHGLELAFLWGDPRQDRSAERDPHPASGRGPAELRSRGPILHAVVVQGRPEHRVAGETDGESLEPGSYVRSKGETVHQLFCEKEQRCILYVRTKGRFDVAAQPERR